MIDNNIAPRIGAIRLDRLLPADLDACYIDLLANGGRRHQGLSSKTVLEIHRVVSNALDLAVDRELIDTNPARLSRPPRRSTRSTVPGIWTAAQLASFLRSTTAPRLAPALHLVAHTGIRRRELAGLNWNDLDPSTATLSITSTRQVTEGRTVEAPTKTRTSRRSIDLDDNTVRILQHWRGRLDNEGATVSSETPMFLNRHHVAPSPESFSQLFQRCAAAGGLPRIRLHDLRHTTRRCSSLPVSRSRSCPNDSATPTCFPLVRGFSVSFLAPGRRWLG